MLVLGRRKGQVIHIGNDIEIEVLAIRSSVVRLGIRAPHKISVVRSEIADLSRAEIPYHTFSETVKKMAKSRSCRRQPR